MPSARATPRPEAEAAEATTPVLTIAGHKATIRFNRPAVMNRVEPADLAALVEMLDKIEADPDIRVLVLTGTGRVFSSGYHIGDLAERRARLDRGEVMEAREAKGPTFEVAADRMEMLRVPTIARLNGGVYGGATDLALACDFRIGIEGMEMFMPAGRLGLHYYRGGLVRYVSRLGVDNAKRLFLTAERIGAVEMARIGYLTALVPAPELDAKVDALAETLCAMAPTAIQGTKRTMNEIARGTLDDAVAEARYHASHDSEENREGLAAFAEKRKPAFKPPRLT
jgi:enoyl-CoA hydratase